MATGYTSNAGVRTLSAFIGGRTGPAIGPARDITYKVVVDFPPDERGPGYTKTFEGVIPNHRRPSSTLEIEAAEIGDECIVRIRGASIKFLIYEGLAAGDECP